MSEHLTQKQIQEYRGRRLSPEELAAVDAHLEECDACARQLMTSAQRRIAMQTIQSFLAPPVHLPYEAQEKYVDGAVSEAERGRIEAHLRDCSLCREDVEDLRAFRFALLNDPLSQIAAPPAQSKRKSGYSWRLVLRTGAFSLASAAVAAALVWFAIPHSPAPDNAALEAAQRQLAQERNAHQADLVRTQAEVNAAQVAAKTAQEKTKIAMNQKDNALNKQKSENDRLRSEKIALQSELTDAKNRKAAPKANSVKQYAVIKKAPGRSPENERQITMAGGPISSKIRHELQIGGGLQMRGAGFKPLHPMGVVVLSDQPTLVWEELRDAQDYSVTVWTLNNEKKASTAAPIKDTQWQVTPPLRRGVTYYWKVSATAKNGQTVTPQNNPKPRFRVIEKERLPALLQSELREAERLAQNGLYDEAEARLQALISAAPAAPESKKAAKLLQTIRDERSK